MLALCAMFLELHLSVGSLALLLVGFKFLSRPSPIPHLYARAHLKRPAYRQI